MDQNLEPRWRALWQQLGAAAPPDGVFDRLMTSWCEPHRHHHTPEHLRECSAAIDVVQTLAAAGRSREAIGTVRRMILATRHRGRLETPDEALLLDIDLGILGAPSARFDRYEDDIRAEFHSVPWPLYVVGRRRVLRGFQDRHRLFNTGHFHDTCGTQARVNLSRSLKRLRPLCGPAG